MKRHVQKTGVRYWSGDDLLELQSEPLEVVESFFSQFGNMIISGCEVTGNDLSAGLVALNGLDPDGDPVYKVAPVEATAGLTFPVYLTLKCEIIERVYGDGNMKPVKEVYTAELSTIVPAPGVSYLTIYENNADNKRFADNVSPGSRKITLNNIKSNFEGWVTKAAMPTARENLGVAVVDGKIYVIGGYNRTALGVNECYDPATDSWTTKASMPTARYSLGVTVVDGKIYAIGGYNSSRLGVNECYDPTTDSWTTKAAMPTARHFLAAATVDGKIYVIGGMSMSLGINECYDPATDSWTTKTAMPTARGKLGAVITGGKIYAVGGRGDSSEPLGVNECYDPATDSWTAKATMPTARNDFGMTIIGNKIYAIGGLGANGVVGINECYDPVTDNWTTKATMPTAKFGLGVVAVAGEIYVIGGHTTMIVNFNECYTVEELKTLKIKGSSKMLFDKNVLWGDEVKPANTFFNTTYPGTLSLIETDVSGEISESLDITYNNL